MLISIKKNKEVKVKHMKDAIKLNQKDEGKNVSQEVVMSKRDDKLLHQRPQKKINDTLLANIFNISS